MAEETAIFPHDEQTMNSEQFFLFDHNHDDSDIGALIDELMQEPSENLVGNNISGINFQENNGNSNVLPQNSTFGNPIRIPVWPVPPSPHSCTCCQTLREFWHINGTHVHKLDIHGRLGIISHALLERYNDASAENREYHMFDFCPESISSVKQFLVQYCEDRKREGFIMLQDPLFYFYDALCVGLDGDRTIVTENSLLQTARAFEVLEKNAIKLALCFAAGDDTQINREDALNHLEEEGNGNRIAKSHISSQRERTRKMKLKDLAAYFHLTINEASRELNMCASAVKSICRKEGLRRWPYRKIKKVESDIAKLTMLLNSDDADQRAYASTKINELQQFLTRYYEFNVG